MALGNLASPLAAFAASPILAHALGVEGRGEVAAGTSLLLLFSAIGTLGLTDAATYFVAARIASPGVVLRRSLLYLLGTGILLTAVSYAIAPVISAGANEITSIVRTAGLAILPTLLLGALRGVAQGGHRWALVNAEKYITAVCRVAPLLVLLLAHALTPFTGALVMAWAPVVGGVAYLGLLRSVSVEEPAPAMTTAPRLILYGMSVWVGSLSGIILSRIDQAIMTPLAGTYQLGLYVVAVNLAELLIIAQSAIGQVLFAADAQNRKDERMYLGSRLSIMVTVAICIPLGGLVWVWITFLFGSAFLPAIPAVLLLLLSILVGAPGSVAGTATSARGKPALRSVAIMSAAVLNVILILLLVPGLGATGAAAATLGGSVLGSGLNLIFARRSFGMSVRQFCVPRLADIRTILSAVRNRRAGTR